MEGFYLATPKDYEMTPVDKVIERKGDYNTAWTLLDDPSWCLPCPNNCNCNPTHKANNDRIDVINLFTLTARQGYYKDS